MTNTTSIATRYLNTKEAHVVLSSVIVILHTHTYTECPRKNVPDFGRVFLMLKYTNTVEYQYNEILGTSEISLL